MCEANQLSMSGYQFFAIASSNYQLEWQTPSKTKVPVFRVCEMKLSKIQKILSPHKGIEFQRKTVKSLCNYRDT